MTDEEVRARAPEIARGLDALDDMGDEEEQAYTLDLLVKPLTRSRYLRAGASGNETRDSRRPVRPRRSLM
jgi:hypothetical protein